MDTGRFSDASCRAVVETAISPYVLLDHEGVVLASGGSVTELLGWSQDELAGRGMLDFVDPASHAATLQAFTAATSTPQQAGAEWVGTGLVIDILTADGQSVPCDVSVATSARTGIDGFLVQMRRAGSTVALHRILTAMAEGEPLDDVLASVAAMLEVSLAATLVEIGHGWDGGDFTSVVSGSAPLITTDDGGDGERPWLTAVRTGELCRVDSLDRLPRSVRAAAEAVGARGLIVQPVFFQPLDKPAGAVLTWMRKPLQTGFYQNRIEEVVQLTVLALQWHEGRRSLEWEAGHDALTGLDNRRSFVAGLRRATEADDGGAVLYMDLDDFKPINDVHGHPIGDEVLVAVAERFRSCLRSDATIARMGGDEFAVFCPGLRKVAAANDVAVRLLATLDDPVTIDVGGVPLALRVSASIGVALVGADGRGDHVLAVADTRLLAAKAAGKSQVRDRSA